MNHPRRYEALQAMLAEGLEKKESLKSLFGGVGDAFWFWALAEGRETEPLLRRILPDMPPPQIQANFTGRSGRPALREAYEIYRLFKRLAKRHGKALDPSSRILDFGCGWGRILRFFLKDVDEANAQGVDCYGEMIDLCKSQRLRGSRSVGGTDLAQQCLLVIGQGNGGFGQFVEQFAHFGGDTPQRGFVKPALVAQYFVEQRLPGAFGQGVGDAVERGTCHVVFQCVEAWQQQGALYRLQQRLAQGRHHRQGGGQYAQRRQVACGDGRCVQRQQVFGQCGEKGFARREGLGRKAHACSVTGKWGL